MAVLAIGAGSLQALTFEVANCEFANLRTGPGVNYPTTVKLQKGVQGITLIGQPVFNGPTKWQQVNSRGATGWVNANFLEASAPAATVAPALEIPVQVAPSAPAPVPASADFVTMLMPAPRTTKHVPDNVFYRIRVDAQAEYPHDYEMQRYVIKKQVEAWEELNN